MAQFPLPPSINSRSLSDDEPAHQQGMRKRIKNSNSNSNSNPSSQQGRSKRIKIENSNSNPSIIMDGLKLKLILKSRKPTPTTTFDLSTWSPDQLNDTLFSELNKIKRGLIYELQKVEESFASEVAMKIEYNSLINNDDDPFVIKKKLEVSDIRKQLARLILKKDQVRTFILPLLRRDQREAIESGEGIRVSVFDEDTRSYHELTLKRWAKSSKSYILSKDWPKDFVDRRNLQAGDCIGLYWHSFYNRLCFSVISRTAKGQLLLKFD